MSRRARPGNFGERVFPSHDPEGNPLPPLRGCAWWWYLVLLAVPGAALAAAGAGLLASHLADPHARSHRPQDFPQFIALTAAGGAIALIGLIRAVSQKCRGDTTYAAWKAAEPAAAQIFEAKGGYAAVKLVSFPATRTVGGAVGGGESKRALAGASSRKHGGCGGGRGAATLPTTCATAAPNAPRRRKSRRAVVVGGGVDGAFGVAVSSPVDCPQVGGDGGASSFHRSHQEEEHVIAAATNPRASHAAATGGAAAHFLDHPCLLSSEDDEEAEDEQYDDEDVVCVAIEMPPEDEGNEMASQSQPLLQQFWSCGGSHYHVSYGGTDLAASASASSLRGRLL